MGDRGGVGCPLPKRTPCSSGHLKVNASISSKLDTYRATILRPEMGDGIFSCQCDPGKKVDGHGEEGTGDVRHAQRQQNHGRTAVTGRKTTTTGLRYTCREGTEGNRRIGGNMGRTSEKRQAV